MALTVPRAVKIISPSRLSMTLLDLNGELGRVDGGFGLALQRPGFVLCAERARETTVKSAAGKVAAGQIERLRRIAATFRQHFDVDGAGFFIEQKVPDHSGLGSGTQLAMSAGRAFSELYGLGLDNLQIARLAGRGGTSGIGVEAFRAGGFIVDGGHRFGAPDGKTGFTPSSASAEIPPPPILFRHPFPDSWRVVIAIPQGRHVHAGRERDLFTRFCPLPRAEVERLAHLTLLKIMPAIIEQDLEAFGAAVEAVQRVGFKRHEVETQSAEVRATLGEMRTLGLKGVGMSSWGPALFGFAADEEANAVSAAIDVFMARGSGGISFVTQANNCGARVIAE